MKTVKQIVEECNQHIEAVSQLDESNPWDKAITGSNVGLTFKDMPMVIIFQRKTIRTFPNNQLVGLYYAQSIDQYLSLPFNSMTGQFFKEEELPAKVNIRENFNDNLVALRQEGMLANAVSSAARSVASSAVNSIKKGVKNLGRRLGITKPDPRTPADNTDDARQDAGGLGTQMYNALDTQRKQTIIQYRGDNDPPEANTVKENFCSTLYSLREQGALASTNLTRRPLIRKASPRTPADNTDKSRTDMGDTKTKALNDIDNISKSFTADVQSKTQSTPSKPPINPAENSGSETQQAAEVEAGKESIIDKLNRLRDRASAVDDEMTKKIAKKGQEFSAIGRGMKAVDDKLGGRFGSAFSSPNATDAEKENALGRFTGFAAMGLASTGAEAISAFRQSRAEKNWAHLRDKDSEGAAARQKLKIQEPSPNKEEPLSATIQRRKWEMKRLSPNAKAVPKPPPKPAAPVSAKAVPAKQIMKKYFEEDANLGIIRAMIEHDIDMSSLIFEGEKEISINNRIARKLWELHSSLNNENRKEMVSMLNENVTSYRKLINFCIRR